MLNIGGELSCKCGTRRSSCASVFESIDVEPNVSTSIKPPDSPVDNYLFTSKNESIMCYGGGDRTGSPTPNLLAASYFDVAVLRCLFCPQWAEEGVYWALRYLHQRLLEVSYYYPFIVRFTIGLDFFFIPLFLNFFLSCTSSLPISTQVLLGLQTGLPPSI